MPRTLTWRRINARKLDRRIYGRVVAAFRHHRLQDALLVHHKARSPKHPRFRQEGMWVVVVGTAVVRRKIYRFKAINDAPTAWANKVVRLHEDGTFGREAEQRRADLENWGRELAEAITRWRRDLPPEEHGCNPTLTMLVREYEYAFGPAPSQAEMEASGDQFVPRPLPAVDHRKKRFRTIVNYDLPLALDELPRTLFLRHRTNAGFLRRFAHAERRRRRLWQRRHPGMRLRR